MASPEAMRAARGRPEGAVVVADVGDRAVE